MSSKNERAAARAGDRGRSGTVTREIRVRGIGWVECDVTGRHRAATLYSPAEDPQIEIISVTLDDLSLLDDLTMTQVIGATADALRDED